MAAQVSVGPTSIAGWLASAGSFISAFAVGFQGSEAQLNGPAKTLAIIGLAALALTNIPRYFQAQKLTPAGGVAAPTEVEEESEQPPVEQPQVPASAVASV